jgi:CHAT domain-containing protein/predicted negative regulator of RcsB-dependent stress response
MFEEALPLIQEAGTRRAAARVLGSLAGVTKRMGDLDTSLRYYERALATARQVGDRTNEMRILNGIGGLHMHRRDYSAALEIFEQALPLVSGLKNKHYEAVLLQNIGRSYMSVGEHERARDHFLRRLALSREMGNKRWTLTALLDLVTVEKRTDRLEEAARYLEEARPLAEALDDPYAEAGLSLAEAGLLLEKGDATGAIAAAERSLKLQEKAGATDRRGGTLLLQARALGEGGQLAAAEKSLSDARRWAEERSDEVTQAAALTRLASIHRGQEKIALARSELERAIELLEKTRSRLVLPEYRETFLASVMEPFTALVGLLAESDPESAFEIMERGRARAFLDLLNETRLEIRRGVPPELLERQRSLLARMDSLEEKIREAEGGEAPREKAAELQDSEREYETVLRQIRSSSPSFARAHATATAGIQRIRESLGPSSALIEFLYGSDETFAALLTRDRLSISRLGSPSEIGKLVDSGLEALKTAARPAGEWRESGERIYRALLDPVLKGATRNISRLIIVPDGPLWHVPFEALLLPKDGAFLIERFEVTYAPSASVFLALESLPEGRQRASDSLLAFADPSPIGKFPPLPHGREEVEALRSWFPADRATIRSGDRATTAALRQEELDRYSVLHFATHAVIDPASPARSSLILASEEGAGRISVREIFNFDLDANLVVLSACETSLGRVLRGEGMQGMVRAFMTAGADSVMASLWRVADDSTAVLMREFYEGYRKRGLGKSAALRQAKLSYLRKQSREGAPGTGAVPGVTRGVIIESAPADRAHPYYWAGIVLHGLPD